MKLHNIRYTRLLGTIYVLYMATNSHLRREKIAAKAFEAKFQFYAARIHLTIYPYETGILQYMLKQVELE